MNKLLINSRYIEIQCSRGDTETLSKALQLPYVHMNRIKTKFYTSVRNIDAVLKIFRDIDIFNVDTLPPKIRAIYGEEIKRRIETKALLELGPVINNDDWLMPHQRLGVELAKINKRWNFFYDTRTGKTPMSLQIMNDNPIKWLVVCPLILIENAWMEDAAKFFPKMRVTNLHAATKAKRLVKFKEDADVYIHNSESLINYVDEIKKLGIKGIILDESSSLKSHTSKFSKAMLELSQHVDYFYNLSGTPAPNGEHEYYTQMRCVDYYSVQQSYSQFEAYFFDNISYNPQFKNLVVKPFKGEELKRLIKEYSIYIDKSDAFETAGRDFYNIEVDMPEDVKQMYKQMAKEMFCEIEAGDETFTITAPSSAAKINKLRQVSAGFIIDEDGATHKFSNYKIEALLELLKDKVGDNQAIIWANYRREIVDIQEALGDNCAIINGTVSSTEKNDAIKAFKSGKVQFLIANPASADKGLTLTNAHICIYYSLTHSYEVHSQSMDRIYGRIQSQPLRCKYYTMIVKGSVDKCIQKSVEGKRDCSMEILNHLRMYGGDK